MRYHFETIAPLLVPVRDADLEALSLLVGGTPFAVRGKSLQRQEFWRGSGHCAKTPQVDDGARIQTQISVRPVDENP